MTYVVTDACIDCLDRSCTQVCPVDCIYEGGRMTYINPNECIDCGACEPVCPEEAIFYEDDLPEEMKKFEDAATAFFERLGNRGGAKKVGKQDFDTGPAATRGEKG